MFHTFVTNRFSRDKQAVKA